MKKYYTIICLLFIMGTIPGQELNLDFMYSKSTLKQFRNSVGFDIGYSKLGLIYNCNK
jgi:hypothetical protein